MARFTLLCLARLALLLALTVVVLAQPMNNDTMADNATMAPSMSMSMANNDTMLVPTVSPTMSPMPAAAEAPTEAEAPIIAPIAPPVMAEGTYMPLAPVPPPTGVIPQSATSGAANLSMKKMSAVVGAVLAAFVSMT